MCIGPKVDVTVPRVQEQYYLTNDWGGDKEDHAFSPGYESESKRNCMTGVRTCLLLYYSPAHEPLH